MTSTINLRIVNHPTASEGGEPSVPEMDSAVVEPRKPVQSAEYDLDLDLRSFEDDDIEGDPEPAQQEPKEKQGGGLAGFVKAIASLVGVLMILFVAIAMYAGGSKDPAMTKPIAAKVDVLEMAGRIDRPAPEPVLSASEEEPAIVRKEQTPPSPVDAAVAQSLDPGSHPESETTNQNLISTESPATATQDDVMSFIAEARQLLAEQQDAIKVNLEQIRQFQDEIHSIRTSSEATDKRVGELINDVALVRHSLEDLTAKQDTRVAHLQRQLTDKQQQERAEAARYQEPPAFRIQGITQWGADSIATLILSSGRRHDVTLGDEAEGWKITGISATTVAVSRLRDGFRLNLAAGG